MYKLLLNVDAISHIKAQEDNSCDCALEGYQYMPCGEERWVTVCVLTVASSKFH